MFDKEVIVAIIDIVNSKEYSKEDRNELDLLIRNIILLVEKAHFDRLVTNISITHGDSIEMVCLSMDPICYMLDLLDRMDFDVDFRFGIGEGKLTLVRDNADQCDGPPFWEARRELKNKKNSFIGDLDD